MADATSTSVYDGSWLTLAVVALLTITASRILYSLYLHPLAGYPGPLIARLGIPLLSWSQIQGIRSQTRQAMEEIHAKYGTWVRTGYNELSTIDPQAIPVVYAINSKWTKSEYYSTYRAPNVPDSIMSARDVPYHSAMRKQYGPTFTLNSILKMERLVQDTALRLNRSLAAKKELPSLDIGKRIQFMTTDVVGCVSFGSDDGFGLIDADEDKHGTLQAAFMVNNVNFIFGNWQTAGRTCLNWLASLTGPPPQFKTLSEFAVGIINRRLAEKGKTPDQIEEDDGQEDDEDDKDMLAYFMRVKDFQRPDKKLSHYLVMQASLASLVGGSDTTSSTIQGFVFYVLSNKRVNDRLVKEFDDAFESGQLSWPPKYAESVKLPYFEACIRESMRVWPAIAWMLPRKAPKGGATIGDRYFAQGTDVGVAAAPYHLSNKEVFGPDADQFRPERWLEADAEQRKRMNANFLSFGMGTRTCIGQNLAMTIMCISLPMLFRQFELEITPRSATSPHKKPLTQIGVNKDQQTWNVHQALLCVPSEFYCSIRERKTDGV